MLGSSAPSLTVKVEIPFHVSIDGALNPSIIKYVTFSIVIDQLCDSEVCLRLIGQVREWDVQASS